MAVETIAMNDDGTFQLRPPFIVLRRTDQNITWKLTGANWVWMTTPPGITVSSTAPSPYSPWPSLATGPSLSSGDYVANANSPNLGTDWIYYKWTFSVINTVTNQIVQIDPDIGNDPQP